MAVGLGLTLYYLVIHNPAARAWLPSGLLVPGLWWGIEPISAGAFGAPAGALAGWLVSLLARRVSR